MVSFNRFTLSNGLRVIVHEDPTTPMAVMNLLYDVGARDEDPERTGFAHLFEHLMFGGSVNIPAYDEPLQRVGGENNAFTSNDVTNYYITLPAVNLETAFWLESDRMLGLAFNEKSLDVQRNVVCEEFKQRYLNQPYGDVWLKLRPLAYRHHPYRWATIGKELSHIEEASMRDVKAFFTKHYTPLNAVLVVGGDVKTEAVRELAERWFGPIPAGEKQVRNLVAEPPQQQQRRLVTSGNVPVSALYMAFHIPARTDPAYYAVDLIVDILSRGKSSRMYLSLVKEQQVFAEVNAYHTSSRDPGLLIVEGKPVDGVSLEDAEKSVWDLLAGLRTAEPDESELAKVKNKVESTLVFGETELLEKAMNLAFFELSGDAGLLNSEVERYLSVTTAEIRSRADTIFVPENCSILYYLPEELEA